MGIIGVIGGGRCTDSQAALAQEVGKLIAQRGAALVCGGLGGVMEAACQGAHQAEGVTIGVIPGESRKSANRYVTLPIVTGMGHARNVIVVHTAEVVIAIGGEEGTMSEIAIALKTEKPVISIGPRPGFEGVVVVETAQEAVDQAFEVIDAR